ncbi:MAG: hydrogenase maturation nickel metallochaperone HypA [Anaerolineaceae bacterium]|nr:hydrogenase maturation nickel metallochaperone HypA [Anaerolineaceae bacterium]
MHELSVTENILKIATAHAEKVQAKKVTDVYLIIGQLSSIIDDSVTFYWDIITKDSICDDAKLHFHRIPAEFKCQDCNHTYKLEFDLTPCPVCNSTNIRVISGDEFNIESIDITK